MRLAVVEANLDTVQALMPFDHVGTPMLHYFPACQCFRASVGVLIDGLPLDRARTELLQRTTLAIVRLRAAIPELKDSDIHIQFTQFGKEIANFDNGELTLK